MSKYTVFHSHEVDPPIAPGWYVGRFEGRRFVSKGAAGPYSTCKDAAAAMPEDFSCYLEGKPCDRWCGANPCLKPA